MDWLIRRQSRIVLLWLAVALVAVLAAQPLLGSPIQGHDTLLHFYRIPEVNALLRQGVFFSRWLPNLMLGYGYPLFNFYPPLSAYGLTLSYWLAGANAPLGLILAFVVTLLVASAGMFALARELYGEAAGLVAAAAYTLSPTVLYHVFERGSLSNSMAMALFPLAALALVRAVRAPQPHRQAWAALLFAAVLLSHTAASLTFALPLAALGLTASFTAEKRPVRRSILLTAIPLAGGLAAAAFVWLPALAEVRFTAYARAIRSPDLNYTHFFADVLRWPQPAIDGVSNPTLPVGTGLLQLTLGIIATGLAWARLARRRSERTDSLTAVAGVMGIATVFLATPLSAPLWERIALLRYFQFPFRWLDAGAFLLAVACGAFLKPLKTSWQVSILCASLLPFFANAAPYLYPPRWHYLPTRPTLADASNAQVTWGIYGLTSWGEYAPAMARLRPIEPAVPGADLGASLAQKLRSGDLPPGALLSSSGTAWHADLRVRLATAAELTFEAFYFPGWVAQIDGRSAPLGPDGEGRLTLTVPAGEHTVSVHFGSTSVRSLADGLSLLGALAIAISLLWRHRSGAVPRPQAMLALPTGSVLSVAGMLALLVLAKVFWLDRFDTPLVRHVRRGTLARAATPVSRNFGGELQLVGYEWDAPDVLVLFWQSLRTPSRDYTVEVRLTDTRGASAGVVQHTHPGLALTSRWEPGQLVRDPYALPLNGLPCPSAYHLTVSLLDPDAGAALPLLDAPVSTITAAAVGTVKIPPLVSAPARTAPVRFAGAIGLEEAVVPAEVQAGDPLNYTLVWRSLSAVDKDYTVFVHLVAADGTLASTADAPPCKGSYPTSFWSAEERIVDERQWLAAVPPGDYEVACGLYLLETGERLTASGANVDQNNQVSLGVLHVNP